MPGHRSLRQSVTSDSQAVLQTPSRRRARTNESDAPNAKPDMNCQCCYVPRGTQRPEISGPGGNKVLQIVHGAPEVNVR